MDYAVSTLMGRYISHQVSKKTWSGYQSSSDSIMCLSPSIYVLTERLHFNNYEVLRHHSISLSQTTSVTLQTTEQLKITQTLSTIKENNLK